MKTKKSPIKKELKIMNKAAFSELRGHLLKVLLTDPKIGIAPTIEVIHEMQEKIPCLRCGFKFYGNANRRICKPCRDYNRGVNA